MRTNNLPSDAEIDAAVSNRVGRRIAKELVGAPDGLSIHELKARIPEFASQTHFDRRLRDLDKPFVLERERRRGDVIYRLTGKREAALHLGNVSKTLRAEILYRDGSRCQMCGRSPQDDPSVKLEIDHKIPLQWGGTNDEDNLWTLCKEDNEGKRAFFSSVSPYSDQIRAAVNHDEVHRRLGELLKAFGVGVPVPSSLLSIVASAGRYQEDWQRRLRELRDLGWDYKVTKHKENGRIVSDYILTKDGGWPPSGVSIRERIR